MGQPYVGEIRIFAGNFAPAGWMICAGQLLPISENDTLFNLIGTTYGGDGQETFGLPDLQGRAPIHMGNGYVIGETLGVETVTLTTAQIPTHSHSLLAAGAATTPNPQNALLAESIADRIYDSASSTTLAPQSIGGVGGSQPHENMQPYVVINYIISLYGIFPTQT